MSTIELTTKIKELKELEALIKQAEKEADAIKTAVRAIMIEKGVDEMTVDVYTIRNKVVKSSRLDSKSLKAELPEIAERYTVPTESVRFTVA